MKSKNSFHYKWRTPEIFRGLIKWGGGEKICLYSEWALLFHFFVFLKCVKIFYCTLTTLNVSLSSTEEYIKYFEYIMNIFVAEILENCWVFPESVQTVSVNRFKILIQWFNSNYVIQSYIFKCYLHNKSCQNLLNIKINVTNIWKWLRKMF